MSGKITYPFSAIPNHIARGGHGAINLAVLTAIVSHGECFASVSTLSKEVGCSVSSVRNAIKYWSNIPKELGIDFQYKNREGATNLIRVIFNKMETPTKNDTPIKNDTPTPIKIDSPPLSKLIAEEEYSKKNTVKNTTTIVVEEKSYGNPDVNWVFEEFERIRGFKSQGTVKKDRFMCKHLLNNFSKEQITSMLQYLETGEYVPSVGSIEQLWFKRGQIVAGIKKIQGNSVIRIS